MKCPGEKNILVGCLNAANSLMHTTHGIIPFKWLYVILKTYKKTYKTSFETLKLYRAGSVGF